MLSLMSRMFTDARLKAQGSRTILPSPFSKYQRQPSMHVSQFPKAWEQLKRHRVHSVGADTWSMGPQQ